MILPLHFHENMKEEGVHRDHHGQQHEELADESQIPTTRAALGDERELR
jgi:hypothetical protein